MARFGGTGSGKENPDWELNINKILELVLAPIKSKMFLILVPDKISTSYCKNRLCKPKK